MAIFKGFVAAINSKSGRTSKGKSWTVYSMKVEKEDGTEYDKWISCGFTEPDVKKGDYVKITTETNEKGYENAVDGGIKKLKNAPARVGKGGDSASGKNVSSSTQQSIHYQNSRNLAVAVLGILNDKDALPLSAAKTAAGAAKRYEEIMALVDKLTVRFFYDAETLRLLTSVTDEGKPAAADGELPEDDDGQDDEDADEEQDDEDGDDDEDDSDDE